MITLEDAGSLSSTGIPPSLANATSYRVARTWTAWILKHLDPPGLHYRGNLSRADCYVLYRRLTRAEMNSVRVTSEERFKGGSITCGLRRKRTVDLASDEGQCIVSDFLYESGVRMVPR